jgi:hypothetical protein
VPNGFIPDEGLSVQLTRLVNPVGAGAEVWRAVFWVNPLIPDHTITLAGLTLATWPGYTFVTLDPTKWTAPVVSSDCAVTNYGTTALTWNVTGPTTQTNYGYALVAPGAGVIRWIQRFDDADIKPLANGDQVTLLPQYSLTSAACPGMGFIDLRRVERRRSPSARRYDSAAQRGEEDRG